MYALLMLFAFLLLPLAYFFYEEKDEEAGTSCGKRLFGAMKYVSLSPSVLGLPRWAGLAT